MRIGLVCMVALAAIMCGGCPTPEQQVAAVKDAQSAVNMGIDASSTLRKEAVALPDTDPNKAKLNALAQGIEDGVKKATTVTTGLTTAITDAGKGGDPTAGLKGASEAIPPGPWTPYVALGIAGVGLVWKGWQAYQRGVMVDDVTSATASIAHGIENAKAADPAFAAAWEKNAAIMQTAQTATAHVIVDAVQESRARAGA